MPEARVSADGEGGEPGPTRETPRSRDAVFVRFGREADLAPVLEIENASFTTPWSRRTFEHLLARENARLLSALDAEGRLLGYAVIWFTGDEGELGNLAVHPEARGRGVADRLLEAVLEEASGRGVSSLFLEVRTGNEAARALYRKHGFDQIGRRPGYYRKPVEDALIMRRLISR